MQQNKNIDNLNKEQKIEFLRDILFTGFEIGRTPSKDEYDRVGSYNSEVGITLFGNWYNTLSAVGSIAYGLEPSDELKNYIIENYEDCSTYKGFEKNTLFGIQPRLYGLYFAKNDHEPTISKEEVNRHVINYFENSYSPKSDPGEDYIHFKNMSKIYKTNFKDYIYYYETFLNSLYELNLSDKPKSILQYRKAEPELVDEMINITRLAYTEHYYKIENNTNWSIQTATTITKRAANFLMDDNQKSPSNRVKSMNCI